MLLALVEHRDRHVSKKELLNRVWPGVVVEENNLEVHIWSLRKILGTQAIATIPGRGYRFAAQLDEEAPTATLAVIPPQALKTNLPERLPRLIGREGDLEALRHLVEQHPLVTIVGTGGIGKTLLAQHLLDAARYSRPHGVCWVELAPLSDASLVVGTIASALGVQISGGDPLGALASMVAPLKMIIALDNAEHLSDEVARVAGALLVRAPRATIVVTSQAPLKLAREHLHRLGPLATPEQEVSPTEALDYGAVALFTTRAQESQRRFELSDANVDAVCTVCRRLDGSALAIELAAARVPLLGVQRLAESLDERLHLLTKGHRDAPVRQQTLRAALEWSHGLLNAHEQLVFRRLAVFAGGCTLELAQDVLVDDRLERWLMLDALDALVDRSLVAASGAALPRYRLLESPHALACESLAASDEEAPLRARHATAVQARFGKIYDEYSCGMRGNDEMRDLLEPDLDNARAAMDWALRHSPALAVALAPLLSGALTTRRIGEGHRMWQATEACLSDDLPLPLRADWAVGAALFHTHRNSALAQACAQRAADMCRSLGNTQGLVRALSVLARGRSADAVDLQRTALDELQRLVRPDSPPVLRVFSTTAECMFAYHHGELQRAETLLRQWFVLSEQVGSQGDRDAVRNNLAELALANGNAAEAVRQGRELEHDWSGSRDIRSLATARMNLTAALLACDDVSAARETAQRGWPLAAQFALQPYWVDSLALLAALEGRARASACLRGHSDAGYAAIAEQREATQMRSAARAEAISRAALGDAAYEALRLEGAQLSHEQAGVLAFEHSDAN